MLTQRLVVIPALIMSVCCATSSYSQEKSVVKESSAPQPVPTIITADMRAADPRLDVKVTAWRQRVTICELLEELGPAVHARIDVGMRGGAADWHVAVFCRDVPLHQLLNAIWSLMSYKGAAWRWDRAGEPGRYTYRLAQPVSAQRLRDRLNGWMQDRFEANARLLMRACDGTEEQKKQSLKEIYGRPDIGNATLSPERVWADVSAFKHLLTADQQRQVLKGQAQHRAPIGSLDSRSRGVILKEWHGHADTPGRQFINGVEVPWQPPKEPEELVFKRMPYANTPALVVETAGELSASPYQIGGVPIERAYRKYLREMWEVDGDGPADGVLDTLMTVPVKEEPVFPTGDPSGGSLGSDAAPWSTQSDLLIKRLADVSLGAKVPVLLRLPEDNDHHMSLGEPWGHTLREYWEQLWNQSLMVKWRGRFLLASNNVWPTEPPPTPLIIFRRLRAIAKPGELLPFETLVEVAGSMSGGQIRRLRREFPDMQAVAELRPLLALFAGKPDVLRGA